jgi:ComF family protein
MLLYPLESAPDGRGRTISLAAALERIGRAAANFVLPSRCLACDSRPVEELFRGGVCDACWQALPRAAGPRCNVCDEPLAALGAERCGRCMIHPPAFRSMRAAAPYRGAARSILLAFKFRGADYLGPRLAQVLVERFHSEDRDEALAFEEVVAVPATGRSLRRRGYHPADLLAEAVAKRLRVPFAGGRLRKIRETVRQSGLPVERRRANVRGAFAASGRVPRRLLIVDDVATSGWTARECAAVLARAGAEELDVWCFARASRDDLDPDTLP